MVYAVPRMQKRINLDMLDFMIFFFAMVLMLCFFIGGPGIDIFAADRLTDMFQTKSFRGSSEALSKANFIGAALHYIISWFSFLGLCLTLYQKFITLLYLSARNLFDTIYEIKMSNMKGSGIAGLKGLFDMVKSGDGGGGGGFDVFITFFYGLLPNIKAYSDYCPDKLRHKLDENDGPVNYMLKTAIPTVMLIFFLTIGYSGTLGKAYGVVVDGMATFADNLVTKNLSAWVNKVVAEGDGYQFQLAGLGSIGGEFAEKVARELYATTLGMCDNTTPDFRNNLGRIIEESVYGIPGSLGTAGAFTEGGVMGNTKDGKTRLAALATESSLLGSVDSGTVPASDDSIRNMVYDHYVSLTPAPIGDVGIGWSVEELILAASNASAADGNGATMLNPTAASKKFLHVIVRLKTTGNVNYIQQQDPGLIDVDNDIND